MISRTFGSQSYDTTGSGGKGRLHSILDAGGTEGLSASSLYRNGLTSLPFDVTRFAATNGLPLNLLVDAAIGTVAVGRNSVSSHSHSGNNNFSHQTFLAGLKRGLQESQSVAALPNNLNVSSFASSSVSSFPQSKKARVDKTSQDDNSALMMQRLNTMNGGFPMPRWSAFLKGESTTSTMTKAVEISKSLDIPPSSIGAFPMPRVKDDDKPSSFTEDPVLTSFQQVWDKHDGDHELQKEILARKLEKTNFSYCKKA
ncbi:hypothetical protein IV203_018622 [Nitzschia inconspicua]|uniref:Uncharacterized protein n=1 Tax=Nitzschia inconspicua TaxID=303405 RepID=A0A9K3Q8V0_9STRA|nr:hypothetical protein IV203_018622 [Nitzschia inconspicua]